MSWILSNGNSNWEPGLVIVGELKRERGTEVLELIESLPTPLILTLWLGCDAVLKSEPSTTHSCVYLVVIASSPSLCAGAYTHTRLRVMSLWDGSSQFAAAGFRLSTAWQQFGWHLPSSLQTRPLPVLEQILLKCVCEPCCAYY